METEEAALLHEEATMTIEELLARYGQNLNAVKHAAAIRYKFVMEAASDCHSHEWWKVEILAAEGKRIFICCIA